ncbi:Lrp/AsnC family transcriptional regulator [Candidatus Micrarchaeota archaeon]|nr:Lrp/AsnC family transcriptional regulator [Candidatus Micrarchaeota archaeon]
MLNAKDRKLIKILDKNSRTSNAEIAKKMGISKQLVAYRIEKLVNEGLIEKFYTIINGVKLGYLYFRIYLKFQRISSNKEQSLIDAFVSNSFTTWVVKCRGSWDLVVSIYAKDTDQLAKTYQNIVEEFEGNILAKKIVLVQNVLFSTRDYLSDSEGSIDSVYGGVTENLPIDKTDHIILKDLSKNSRTKIIDLARNAGASVETIKSHIKKMEASGIIRGHKLTFRYSKLGVLFYIISINLSNASETARKKIQDYCKSHPNSVYLVNILGDHDIDLEVEVENQEQLDIFLRDLANKFYEIIRNVDSLQIVQQYKIDFYPFE